MNSENVNIKLASWFVFNVGVLGLFLGGNLMESSTLQLGVLNISVFMYWLLSFVGVLVMIDKVAEDMVEKKEAHYNFFVVPKALDITFDFVVLLTLVYFGYFILGAFFLLHIIGTSALKTNVEKYSKIKNDLYDEDIEIKAQYQERTI